MPEVEWFTGPFATAPPDDVRTAAFPRLTKLYASYLPRGCVAALGVDEAYKCELPHYSYPHLTVPVFIIEAITDSVVLGGFEGMAVKSLLTKGGAEYAAEYGANSSRNMAIVLESERDGIFGASCLLHCGFTLTGPLIDGQNAIQALYDWAQSHARPDLHRSASSSKPQRHHYIDRPGHNGLYWPPSGSHCPVDPTASAASALPQLTESTSAATITIPLIRGIPMMLMGGNEYAGWFQLAGKGAGIQTFYGYGNGPHLAPELAKVGRENVFVSTGIPCGGIDSKDPPMNSSAATALIDNELAQLKTTYADLLLLHHRCHTAAETSAVWVAMEAAKKAGKARHLGVSNFNAHDLASLSAVTKEPIEANEAHFGVGVMDFEVLDYMAEHRCAIRFFFFVFFVFFVFFFITWKFTVYIQINLRPRLLGIMRSMG